MKDPTMRVRAVFRKPEQLLRFIGTGTGSVKIHGRHYHVGLDNFYLKSIKKLKDGCPKCGRKVTHFTLEETVAGHLKLKAYGLCENIWVMFNIDHIRPKAAGGKDKESNYQVMCFICNWEKGPHWEKP